MSDSDAIRMIGATARYNAAAHYVNLGPQLGLLANRQVIWDTAGAIASAEGRRAAVEEVYRVADVLVRSSTFDELAHEADDVQVDDAEPEEPTPKFPTKKDVSQMFWVGVFMGVISTASIIAAALAVTR